MRPIYHALAFVVLPMALISARTAGQQWCPANPPADAYQQGYWGPPKPMGPTCTTSADCTSCGGTVTCVNSVCHSDGVPCGIVGSHAILLFNGKVMLIDEGTGKLVLFDSSQETVGPILPSPQFHRLFCSGHVQLPDGRILFQGSSADVRRHTIYDPNIGSCTRLPDFTAGYETETRSVHTGIEEGVARDSPK